MRRSGVAAVVATFLAPLVSACGGNGDVHGSCTTSPPDVVALADVPFGGGDSTPEAEREAEVRYTAAHPEVFAGGIFGGGHDYIGFTADAATHLAELRKQVPYRELVRAYCADHTNRELVQLQRRISADTKDLASQGIQVITINANTLTERVDIGITHVDAHIEHVLRDRYGDLVGKVAQTDPVILR